MPFRHAHWWVLSLFALAALAFWPSYVSQISTAGAEMHAHGITASLWIALLAFQSWTIHGGRRETHRMAGMLSLPLFPLFLAGGVSIFIGMAKRYSVEASPFHVMYAPRLAWLDAAAVTGIACFYFLALKHRRKVHVHSRYLLATALFLIPPILSRLSPILPPLTPNGPDDLYKIGYGVQIANTITIAVALALAMRPAKHGRPFFFAAGLVAASMVLFETVGRWSAWHAVFARAADLPVLPVMSAVAAAGAAIAWAGWNAGKRPVPEAAAAQPA
jgi:hypothetical protein